MSQLNVDTIKKADGTGNLTVPAETGTVVTTASPSLGRRNIAYNGAMTVWQRGTSADTATTNDYMCDRWGVAHSGLDGNVDWDQETASTPDGFGYALKISTDASETSLDAGDILYFRQKFEGQDLQQLQKGTSGAKSLTLSFWVKSSVASTYTVELFDDDNTRVIGKSYTISSADTWEFKTVTFEGDTTGALDNDNAFSLQVAFFIDAGSDFTSGTFSTAWQAYSGTERVYDTTGWLESTTPTFYITGVQLEVGDTATPFEHRSYGEELALCERYYYRLDNTLDITNTTVIGSGLWYNPDQVYVTYQFPKRMRALPTGTVSSTSLRAYYAGNADTGTTHGVSAISPYGCRIYLTTASSHTAGNATWVQFSDNNDGYIEFDAEL